MSDILPPCYLTVSQESQPNVILETQLHWLDWPSSILAKPSCCCKAECIPNKLLEVMAFTEFILFPLQYMWWHCEGEGRYFKTRCLDYVNKHDNSGP